MILLDTSGVLAALDGDQEHHERALAVFLQPQARVLSPFVLAELDYMITTRVGRASALDLLDDVALGAYELATFTIDDVAQATQVLARYASVPLGLTDASILVLAERLQCFDVLTLDVRHFRAVRSLSGTPFRLLPFDP